MAEDQLVLEVGGVKYSVNQEVHDAFVGIRDALVEKEMDADLASETAWDLIRPMFQKMTKKERPEEIVPDIAELSMPFVEKALEENPEFAGEIEAYTSACASLEEALEARGLDTGLELGSTRAQTFIVLRQEWPDDDEIKEVVVKVAKKDSEGNETELSKLATAVRDAERDATASIYELVTAVAEREGVEEPKVTAHIAKDGTIALTGKKRATRRNGGGNATRSSYEYAFDDETKEHVISKKSGDSETEWVRSDAENEDDLLDAIKAKLVAEGKTFAKAHWRGSAANSGRSWWPFNGS